MFRVPAFLCTLVLVVGVAHPVEGQLYEAVQRGDVSEAESKALQELVGVYGFTDLARVWIDARLETVSTASRPDLEWVRDVDILRAEGDFDAANENNQVLKGRYPRHPRASAVAREAVKTMVVNAILKDAEARYETDPAVRATLLAERDVIYQQAMAELEANIQQLNQEVERSPDDEEKILERDGWEFDRLLAMQRYAELLPYESAAATKAWEELAEAAKRFVDTRFLNFGLQYQAQLIYGKALAALGQSAAAAEALEVLTEVEPSYNPPYDEVVVRAMRQLRIEALQSSAEAWNRAGQPERAVELFDFAFEAPQPHFPWKAEPEDPAVLPLRVAMEIEEAIARMCGGVRQVGIDQVRALIARFDSERFRKGDPDAAEDYLLQIARGLARAVDTGVSGLSAELYYRAAVGYKDRGRYDAAIRAAQLALDAGSGVPGAEFWLASSLYEIGDNFDSLALPEAAAQAYEVLATQFDAKKSDERFEVLLADAAQNWFAISGELAETSGGAWETVTKRAEGVFAELSRGAAGIQLILQKAAELEGQSKYEEARGLYESIPSEIEGDGGSMERVDAYYRAQAGAARCLFRAGDADGRAAEVLPQVAERLTGVLERARRDGDASGEAALRFELANARWDDDVRDRAGAIEALDPLLSTVTGTNPYREGGLRLWISILCWVDPEDAADGARPADAEPVLAALRKDFQGTTTFLISLFEMVDAYGGLGTEEADRRAAELALEYTRHPEANFDAASPGEKLGIAEILSQGGKHAEASAILDAARAAASEDDIYMQIAVTYALAKAGNNSGKHHQVIDALDPFIEANEEETTSGSYDEAPYILIQRALANMALYEQDNSAARLTSAEEDLTNGIATLRERRASLLRTNSITQRFEVDYWNAWLQFFEVLRAQGRGEMILRMIREQRIMNGGNDFAPPALQTKFDQLEQELK